MNMKNNVNFGHILTILAIIVIPLIIWAVNVEKRFEQVLTNAKEIEVLKTNQKEQRSENQNNHDEVMTQLHQIELQLKDKKDR